MVTTVKFFGSGIIDCDDLIEMCFAWNFSETFPSHHYTCIQVCYTIHMIGMHPSWSQKGLVFYLLWIKFY